MNFYTVDEVAAMVKVHPTTIKKEIGRGNIAAFKVGNEHRVSEQELNRYTNSKFNIKSENEIKLEEKIKLLSSELETKTKFIEGIKTQLLFLK